MMYRDTRPLWSPALRMRGPDVSVRCACRSVCRERRSLGSIDRSRALAARRDLKVSPSQRMKPASTRSDLPSTSPAPLTKRKPRASDARTRSQSVRHAQSVCSWLDVRASITMIFRRSASGDLPRCESGSSPTQGRRFKIRGRGRVPSRSW